MDPKKVDLRPATANDSRFAFDLKKAALGEYISETFGWDEAAQQKLHEQRFRPSGTQIVMFGGQDIGLLAVDRAADCIRLRQLFLLPEAQGKGIGSHLLAQVLCEARQLHVPVTLRVLKANPRAKAFYERHGFVVVGETETYHQMETVP